MMKILGILGSYNHRGKTAKMLEEVLAGASDAGLITELLYLDEYQVKMSHPDTRKLYAKLLESDCVVLAAPTYWGEISGIAKNFLDCLRQYAVKTTENGDLKPGNLKGKKYITITSCYKTALENIVTGLTDTTFNSVQTVFSAAGMKPIGEVVLTNTWKMSALPLRKKEECYNLGLSLQQTIEKEHDLLKRYIQLFFMIAFSSLLVMGMEEGLAKLGLLNLTNFWVRWLAFAVLFFTLLSVILHTVTVHNHKKK